MSIETKDLPLKVRFSAKRNSSITLGGVEVVFDNEGYGEIPASCKEAFDHYSAMRPGRLVLVQSEEAAAKEAEDAAKAAEELKAAEEAAAAAAKAAEEAARGAESDVTKKKGTK